LCELEGLLANIVSVRGSEENNLQGPGGKLTVTPIPIYRRVIVIDGISIEWGEDPKVSSYCFVLYFLHCSSGGRRDSSNRPTVVVEVVVMEEEVVL
jgi:hypothetical protein